MSQDGILGNDFLSKCQANIDFKDNTIRVLSNLINKVTITKKPKVVRKIKKSTTIPKQPNYGLCNPSKLCFANALYQALIFILFNTERALGVSRVTDNQCPCISNAMLQTTSMLKKATGPVQPSFFHESIKKLFNTLDSQEDALELLTQIILNVNMNLNCCPANQIGIDWAKKVTGTFAKEIRCTKCTNVVNTTEEFHNLQIYPKKNIQDSLECYFMQEELDSYVCSQCTDSYTSILSTKVVNPPEILTIQFVRVLNNLLKNTTKIPLQRKIDITKFIVNENETMQYKLMSLINHIGSDTDNGHFTAVVFNDDDTCWSLNDDKVNLVHVDAINLEENYILFYKRIKTNSDQMKTINQIISTSPNSYDRFETIMKEINLKHMTEEENNLIREAIYEYQDVFCLEDEPLTVCPILKHSIRLYTNTAPINIRQYRNSKWESEEIERQVQKLLKDGIVEHSKSPYNSPLLLVKKKALNNPNKPQTYRLCTDFRQLNAQTIDEYLPTPLVDTLIDYLGQSKSKYYSCLDLRSSYYQIALDDESKEKTAFSTGSSHFQYKRLVMGLKTSSHAFLRAINIAMGDYVGKILYLYMDDIVVFANTLQEHIYRLKLLFQRLRECTLKLSPEKCDFLKPEVNFLGYIISKEGLAPNPEKVRVISEFPHPRNQTAIKSFLGMLGYYRRFIPDFSGKAAPLTNLLRKNTKFIWTDECESAFQYFKITLANPPILQFPDFTKQFILTTDSSSVALSAVLSQTTAGEDLPIAFASRKLSDAETRYGISEQEIAAVLYAISHFRCYIFGTKFLVQSDNKALQWLFQVKSPSSRLMRWKIALAGYNFQIVHIKGKSNKVADCLSRYIPEMEPKLTNETTQTTEAHINVVTRAQKQKIVNIANPYYTTPKQSQEINKQNKTASINNTATPTVIESQDKNLISLYPTELLPIHINNTDGILDIQNEFQNLEIGEISISPLKDKIFIATKNDVEDKIEPSIWENSLTTLQLILETNELYRIHVVHQKMNCSTQEYVTFKNELIKKFTDTKYAFCIFKNIIVELTDILEIEQVLKDFHDSVLSGHQGVNRMTGRVGSQYKWIGMTKDIKDYVKKCEVCQMTKQSTDKTMPLRITTTASRPMQILALDVVGPLVETTEGYKYILTFQDELTRFFGAFPMSDQEAETIAKIFVEKIILQYGYPEVVKSDRGSNFLSDLMAQILKIFAIKKRTTTSFHPEANASLERSHRTLKSILRAYSNEDKNDWPSFIPYAVFVMNTTVNRSTSYEPATLLYGWRISIPTNLQKQPSPIYSYDDYHSQVRYKLQKAYEMARENSLNSKEINKEYFDYTKNTQNIEYKIGDEVLLLDKGKKTKLHNPYIGPFKIIEIISDTNVRLQITRRHDVVHKNLIKPFKR